MALLFAALFIGVPIVEIVVFIEAGDLIGLWPTIGVVIVTGIVGTALLRHQGFGVLRRLQARSQAGEAPLAELFEGVCLLIAGAFLLTPGFVTDSVGFLLFLPPVRWAIARWVLLRFQARIMTASTSRFTHNHGPTASARQTDPRYPPNHQPHDHHRSPPFANAPRPGRHDDVIDGDFTTVQPTDDETPAPKNRT